MSGNGMPENQGGNRDSKGRFKPGMSGNLNGRPKGKTLSEKLRDIADYDGHKFVDVLWRLAVESKDIRAIAIILDRVDGKVADRIEHDGNIELREAILEAMNPVAYRNGRPGGDPGSAP
jgi:hypothetical protein